MNPWEIFEQERAKFNSLNAEYDFPALVRPKQRSHGHTKAPTRNWEKLLYEASEDDAPLIVPTSRLGLEVLFLSQKPVGDLSNCIKLLEDALNRRAYQDDRQIDSINCLRVHRPEFKDRTIVRILEKA